MLSSSTAKIKVDLSSQAPQTDAMSLFEQQRVDKEKVKPLDYDENIISSFLSHKRLFGAYQPPANEEGLLWIIEKEGRKPSYILGTIHVDATEVTAPIMEAVTPIIESVQTVMVECCLEELQAYSSQYHFLSTMNDTQFSLPQLIDQQLMETILDCYKQFLPPIYVDFHSPIIEHRQPWFVIRELNGYLARNGNQDTPSLDEKIYQQAKLINTKIEYLDKSEDVIHYLGCHWPIQQQIKHLTYFIHHFSATKEVMEKTKTCYLQRELSKIFNLYIAFNPEAIMKSEHPDKEFILSYLKFYLFDRNNSMFNKMLPALENGNSFCALGAAHLLGENGVLSLAHLNGFKVTCAPLLQNKALEITNDKILNNTEFEYKKRF
jgi:uncharacterized protein YbaP (TraB family)